MADKKKVWVRITTSNLVTTVSPAYFDKYKSEGWLVEVEDPNKVVVKPPVKKAPVAK